jgi:hypothetical protein
MDAHMTVDEVASSSIPLRGFEHDTETIRSAATRLRLAVEGISSPHSLIGIKPESLIQLDTSTIAIEGALEGITGEIDGATEYTKRRKLIPNALICNQVVADLAKAEGHLDTMAVERLDKPNGPLQVRVTDAFCRWLADSANSPMLGLGSGSTPPPSPSIEITRLPSAGALYYNPSAHNRVRSLFPRIETMRRSLRIDIWIKQPRRETCESLVRACQKAQHDFEDFLAWFTQFQLGLHGAGLDCYIAQVLLGMHVSGGEVRLPGDMRNLADSSEHEAYATILRQARARKAADENGEQDRIPVDPPGTRRSGRRFDALYRADFLEEVGNLFVPFSQLETDTMMRAALIEAATREDFERIFRKVRLPRAHARFAARVLSGRAVLADNPAAAVAIVEKREAIIEAMEDDKTFRRLFG